MALAAQLVASRTAASPGRSQSAGDPRRPEALLNILASLRRMAIGFLLAVLSRCRSD
jgi:hypothetical protein